MVLARCPRNRARAGGAGLAALALAVAGCAENETPPPDRDPFQPGGADGGGGGGGNGLECAPDLDGTIRADQLAPEFGISVDFRISPDGEERPLADELVGTAGADPVWDLAGEYDPADQYLEVEATELGDQWYADEYPGGEFVTVLDPGLAIDAVYSHSEDALYLHGYASAEENPSAGTTLVVYDEPIVAYDFPLASGDAWTEAAEVSGGQVQGLPYNGTETYDFEVAGVGELWLPVFTFESTLRVRAGVTIDTGLDAPRYREQVQFLFECFGEVARVVGPEERLEDGFAAEDYTFDRAVEMRRMGY